ncbi:MAG: hypothetical protein A4S17_01405 [Proteobacteria bacterium HN_bin10]|nr:MAG: hypothetical protein A4S17_01405 [Proteobacteria bacterium HN_bin10]
MTAKGLAQNLRLTFHFLLVTFYFLSGCAWFQPAPEMSLKQATIEHLVALLKERDAAVRTVKGLFRAQVSGPGLLLSQRLEGAMYYRRPHALRVQGFSPIGGPLFDLRLDDDRYRLRLPASGKVYEGQVEQLSATVPIGKPLELSRLALSGAIGTEPVADGAPVELVDDEDRYRLDVHEAGLNGAAGPVVRRIWFERTNLFVVQEERLGPDGTVRASATFEDFRPLPSAAGDGNGTGSVSDNGAENGSRAGVMKPFKATTKDGRGRGSLTLSFHELVPNPTLTPEELSQAGILP